MYYLFKTTKVEATGRAKQTRLVFYNDKIKIGKNNQFRVKITEETHVEKPWYAPSGIFLDKVKEGLIN